MLKKILLQWVLTYIDVVKIMYLYEK